MDQNQNLQQTQLPAETLPSTANGEVPPTRITITLPTNAYFISGIRNFTMEMVKNMTGFSEQWAYRFQSVVDELCNNAIEHGSAPDKDVKVTFVSYKGKSIEIFVEDTGTGKTKKKAADIKKIVEEAQQETNPLKMALRGRGLAQIVSNWTDLLEFKDRKGGGVIVHVVKFLKAEENNSSPVNSQHAGGSL